MLEVSERRPVKLSSSLRSLLEFLLSPNELVSDDLSVRRSQRGDSGKTPGMLRKERRLAVKSSL